MDKKTLHFVVVSVLVILAMCIFVPLPGRPSVWVYLKHKSLNKHLKSFSDPVFLPSGIYKEGSTFSTYLGWNNAYEVKYNGSPDTTKTISTYSIQFTADSTLYSIAGEGPSNQELSLIKNFALTHTGCEPFDVPNSIEYCANEKFGYLIRSIEHSDDETYFMAMTVFNSEMLNGTKSKEEFTPTTTSYEYKVLKTLKPIDISSADEFIKID